MKKILVIEDEKAIREVISDILSFEDFEVIEAENGQEGIRLGICAEPDLIICDVILPEIDGYQVLNHLQQNPATKHIPFIFLTAKDSRPDVRQGMNLGADDYLTKPFSTPELIDSVKRLLLKYSSFQEVSHNYQQTKQQLNYLLSHDILTQCLNLSSLQKKFDNIISRSSTKSTNLIIVCIIINKFYEIKFHQGEHLANVLIKKVAEHLKKLVENQGIVARIDTNEFVVMTVPDATSESNQNLPQLIIDKLPCFYQIGAENIDPNIHIGITHYPQDGLLLEFLLSKARIALGYAQTLDLTYAVYHKSLDPNKVTSKSVLENELNQAIEKKQLELFYQPQFNLLTKKIDGLEALLRWQHPQLGRISPEKFIQIAEENGLIKPITKWVLETACDHTKQWQEAGINPLKISVNFSGLLFNQMTDSELCRWIIDPMTKYNLSADSICLELTESIMIHRNSSVNKKLQQLRNLGISLALDDFGTGYSGLSYLHSFPLDILKIDKMFIDNLERQSHKQRIILNNLISLAKNLNLSVIVEGVENKYQLTYLQECQCDKVQGLLISPALSSSSVENYIKILNNSSAYWEILAKVKGQENFFISDFFE